MLPLISSRDNWTVRRQQLRSQALSELPTFTTSTNMGFAPFERTSSPWKHHIAYRNSSPMKKPVKECNTNEDETKMSTKQFSDPKEVIAARSFRSSTILRQVPIMRRHLDTFGGREFSIPAKTKSVPVHTGRFIYDPQSPPIFTDQLSQNQRLLAEMDMMKKVRGQKRKREALEHRWGWRNFGLLGQEVSRIQRYSIHAEVQKLKELVLPSAAREIYTGRGIRLPATHQTIHPLKTVRPSTEGPYGLPQPNRHAHAFLRYPATAGGVVASHPMVPASHTSQWDVPPSIQTHQSEQSAKAHVPPVTESQINHQTCTIQRNKDVESSPTIKQIQHQDSTDTVPTPVDFPQTLKMHEQVEKIELVDPDMEEQDARAKSELKTVMETPVGRPRSLMAPSASPEAFATNPLLPVTEVQTAPLISESVQKLLKAQYDELKQNGPVKFEDVENLIVENLTEKQREYLQCLHSISSQKTEFVFQELIAYTCLSRIIQNLTPSTAEMIEQSNFETISESVVQYTELFNSVDRAGRGQIGVTALIEILNMTLQKQITSDEKLLNQILATLERDINGVFTKLEFLAYIPYFIHLEEMS